MLARRDIEAGVFSPVFLSFESPRRIPPKPAVASVSLLLLFSPPYGTCVTEVLSPSEVDLIAMDSCDLARRTRRKRIMPISAAMTTATAVNVPATFSVSFQKLSGAAALTVATCVWAGGGTVGVTITVLILPRTVVTTAEGVGDHDDEGGACAVDGDGEGEDVVRSVVEGEGEPELEDAVICCCGICKTGQR